MIYAPFSYDIKQLRKAAIAELRDVSDQRDRDHSRLLGPIRTRQTQLAVENAFDRRDATAQHALDSTARCYMDSSSVCEWRAMVREEIRLARTYAERTKEATHGYTNKEMERYYRTHRVPMRLDGYRRAIAHARPEIAA